MTTDKTKKSKERTRIDDAAPRIERWLVCQKIGVAFYKSNLPIEKVKEIREFFERSDFLGEEIFLQRLVKHD